MDWQLQLISLYLSTCKTYKQDLSKNMSRISNYSNLTFSDEEVITIYMFGIMSNCYKIKDIYRYADRHLRPWFPKLPSYVAFVQRLNKASHLFGFLASSLYNQLPQNNNPKCPMLIDSMPIILAHRGRRFNAKVAGEIATPNGYCATKKLYYYGVKLHIMGSRITGSLPVPRYVALSDAGTPDIRIYEQIAPVLPYDSIVFADKAYQTCNEPIADQGNVILHTPVKKAKGQELLDAADKLLSSAVSSIRQPIESLFNWIEEKTKIQVASKVRSYEGLMVHIFGKISVAFFLMQQRFCS